MMTQVLYHNGTWIVDQVLAYKNWQLDQSTLNWLAAHQVGWFTSIACGYDRTVPLDHYPVSLQCSQFPQQQSQASLHDVYMARARQIWEWGKPVTLLWSGGIDSTSALVALISTNPSWYRDINIVTTANGIDIEAPQFYHQFLKAHNCVTVVDGMDLLDSDFYLDKPLVISGDCADQLFGFGFVSKRLPGPWLTDPSIRDVSMDKIKSMAFDLVLAQHTWQQQNKRSSRSLDLFHQLPEARDIFMTWFEDFVGRSPVPLRDGFDFQWWVAFAMKFQLTRYRPAWMCRHPQLADLNRYPAFFDCAGFERWAIDHHDQKWPGRLPNTYKQPFKDFIFDYTRDFDYKENKGKSASMKAALPDSLAPRSIIKYLDTSGVMLDRDAPNQSLSSQQLQQILIQDRD